MLGNYQVTAQLVTTQVVLISTELEIEEAFGNYEAFTI
jgi:hypothetical protein